MTKKKFVNNAITKEEQRLIDLQYFRKMVIKPFYEEYEKTVNDIMNKYGFNAEIVNSKGELKDVRMFADENGVGYEIEKCKGKYIVFPEYEVCNTRTVGEEKGLSVKHPQSIGLEVEVGNEMKISSNLEKILYDLMSNGKLQ